MRNLAQDARHAPRGRRGRDRDRISEDAAVQAELQRLYASAGLTPRDGLRPRSSSPGRSPTPSGDAILDAMAANPILIERPLVETEKGVRLCRPKERVYEIL